jgi:hypothetical protein
LAADATDAIKVPSHERILPPFTLELPPGRAPAPRSLRTPLIDQLESDPDSVDPANVGRAFVSDVLAGGGHDRLPFTGQSAGLVGDIAPAVEIVGRLMDETEAALGRLRG